MTITTLRNVDVVAPRRPLDRIRTLPHGRYLTVMVLATAVVHGLLGIQQFNQYKLGGFDLNIFDQGVRAYSHFQMPVSPFKYVHNDFPSSFSLLGDHFSPIIAIAAPFYWIWDDPRTLLLVQAAVVSLAIPPVWLFTRRALGTRCAYAVAIAFALSWQLQELTASGFHEAAFAVPIIAVMLERAQARRYGHAMLACCALVLVKEDQGLVVAAFGALLFFRDKRRRAGALLVVGGLLAAFVTIYLLIPAFGGQSNYYWNYTELGPNIPGALAYVVAHPLHTLYLTVMPAPKWQMLMFMAAPVGLLCLASPIMLLAVTPLLERVLSTNSNVWDFTQHYNAFVLPVVMLAAVDGAARLLPRVAHRFPGAVDRLQLVLRRLSNPASWRMPLVGARGASSGRLGPRSRVLAQSWAAFVLLSAIGLCAVFPFRTLLSPGAWEQNSLDRAEAAAVAMIPNGADVEADDQVSTHLDTRTHVLLLDQTPRLQNWVIVRTAQHAFPFTTLQQQADRVSLLLEMGYEEVFDSEGIVVLYRDTPAPPFTEVPQPAYADRPLGGM